MLRRIVRDPRYLPFVFALLPTLLLVPEMPFSAVHPTSGWHGRFMLLYRGDAAPAVEAALPAAAPGSVSRTTSTVRIDAFSEIETLPIDALGARLDPLDPRADAWLLGVEGYFRAMNDGPLVVAYVPAARGRIATWLHLAGAFRAGGVQRDGWRLLEFEPLALLSVPAAALGFSLAIAGWLRRGTRRGMVLAAAGTIAWLPGLLNGGPSDLCVCCAAMYLWLPRAVDGVRPAQQNRYSAESVRTGMHISVLLAVVAAVITTGDAAVYRVARVGASMLCLELLGELAWPFRRLHPPPQKARTRLASVPRAAPRGHAPFVPLAAALAAGILVTVSMGVSHLRAPLPRVISLARAGSRTGIEAAARAGDAGRLPGLAEAVGHAASLQTIAFGAAVDPNARDEGSASLLPPREARVRLREYAARGAGGSLFEAPRTVVRFEPDWLDRLVTGFGAGTVERLLIEQGRAVEVLPRAPLIALLRAVPAALVCLVLLGAPLAGPAARRRLMLLGLWAINEPARRRRTG
jgi:hypothetical protein